MCIENKAIMKYDATSNILLIQTSFHPWMKTLYILVKNVINNLKKKKFTKTYSIWHDLGTGHIQSVIKKYDELSNIRYEFSKAYSNQSWENVFSWYM